MKKNLKVIFIILVVMLTTGCTDPEEKILESTEYLNETINFYHIYNGIMCTDSANMDSDETLNLTYSFYFDEISKLSQKNNDDENTEEIIEFTDDEIIRYYGVSNKVENYENAYYIDWIKESLPLTEENKDKYKYLDKNYYVDLIKSASEYYKYKRSYSIMVSPELIQKGINQMTDDVVIKDEEVYVDVNMEKDKLTTANASFYSEKYGSCNYYVTFRTEFDETEVVTIERPEVENLY